MIVAAGLPDWLDAEFLQAAATVAVLLALGGVLASLVRVRSSGTRLVVALLLAAAAFGSFRYRESLLDCAPTCDCRFLGEPLPADTCAGDADMPA